MFEKYSELVNTAVDKYLSPENGDFCELQSAMYYSASAGGKRIRPAVMLEFGRICGATETEVLPFAVALEMIHTYSLIHDDLPCMDNDDMRRGKPSCHIAFGEATALLAGDALLTDAFRIAMETPVLDKSRIVDACRKLSECAGSQGMIGGQIIDLKYENQPATLDIINKIHLLKTSQLLVAAATIGCILGGADNEKISAAQEFAENLGLAFQIKDDILDITSTAEVLGKPIGSDSDSNKSTYVSLVGLEKAQADVVYYTNKAIDSLNCFGNDADQLKEFAIKLINRTF